MVGWGVGLVWGGWGGGWAGGGADRVRPPRELGRGPPRLVPVTLFLWTWLGSALAHAVFLGLLPSAGYGFAGMAVLGVPLLVAAARARR
ncbi:hypothetical protein [Nocardia abscessus]|uniref:hypothetical protein n=1 Tax=Nocardia abscessus TaxID=120957 RepID=UPI003CC80782